MWEIWIDFLHHSFRLTQTGLGVSLGNELVDGSFLSLFLSNKLRKSVCERERRWGQKKVRRRERRNPTLSKMSLAFYTRGASCRYPCQCRLTVCVSANPLDQDSNQASMSKRRHKTQGFISCAVCVSVVIHIHMCVSVCIASIWSGGKTWPCQRF